MVSQLPFKLDSIVAPTFVGFVILNGVTFALDVALLAILHSHVGVPLPYSITASYACAFAVSFALNRTINFRAHGRVFGQAAKYVVAVIANYLLFILGVSTGLAALGVHYVVARIIAGACEAVFMYSVMRWIVFGQTSARRGHKNRGG